VSAYIYLILVGLQTTLNLTSPKSKRNKEEEEEEEEEEEKSLQNIKKTKR
jgi:hypothetical protein